MGWGAPLGFSSGRSPFEEIVTAGFGEPGWYCRFRRAPREGKPLRARLTTPCASALFDSPEEAAQYTEHPGDIAELARRYLAWAADGTDPSFEPIGVPT
jgi:hypothetical protein